MSQVKDKCIDALKVMSKTPRMVRIIYGASPPLFFALLAISICMGLLPLLNVIVTKLVVDGIAETIRLGQTSGDIVSVELFGISMSRNIVWALALMATSFFASGAAQPLRTFCKEQLGDHLTRSMNLMILRKSISLKGLGVFENPTFYDKLQRAQNEVAYRPLQMIETVCSCVQTVVSLIAMTAIISSFSWILTCAVILFTLPHMVLRLMQVRESWAVVDHEIPEIRRMRYLSYVLTDKQDAKEIRLFGFGQHILTQFLQKFAEFQQRHKSLRRKQLTWNILLSFMAAIASVGMYASIVIDALQSKISLGTMTLYTGALAQIEDSLLMVVWTVSELYELNLFAGRIFDFDEIEDPILTSNSSLPVPNPMQVGIEFRNVSFKYPDNDTLVLDGLSFSIKPGEAVAIVGENGAGKTTIVKLLARMYDPTDGQILVDGVDLRDYDLQNWRSNMSVVFQDFCKFHMTAKENIGIGNVTRVDDLTAVEAAAEKGGATPVVQKLQQGIDTMLGRVYEGQDKGAELSGGEWQKVALARAFMRNVNGDDSASVNGNGSEIANGKNQAQFLILDEPSAALDVQSEYDLFTRFHDLMHGRMVVLISHRFSTVRMADKIILLEHGKVIEEGSHDSLVAAETKYSELYKLQAERYS